MARLSSDGFPAKVARVEPCEGEEALEGGSIAWYIDSVDGMHMEDGSVRQESGGCHSPAGFRHR